MQEKSNGGLQQVETRGGVPYANHDGVSLLGDLYMPAGTGRFPALIAVHGGGWQAGVRSAFQFWGPYLAERGYVLFAISYRLAKKGEKMFPQAVTDVLAAVQFVRASAGQFKVDRRAHRPVRRVRRRAPGIAGGARRREPVFKGAYPKDPHASVSTKVKALVGVYGVYDVAEMWQRYLLQSPRENNIENFMGCAPMDDPRLYFDASPINYATFANNSLGVFLAVGTEDDLVDRRTQNDVFLMKIEAGELLRAALHRAGRAALLAERSDRRARQLFGLHGAAPDALSEGAAVTCRRQSRLTAVACDGAPAILPPTIARRRGGQDRGRAPAHRHAALPTLRAPLRALVQERLERGDLLLVALEIARDLLVEMRGADIELVAGRILADEIGDLVHLGDPAIGLRRHERQAALEPGQHLRLAELRAP